MTKLKPRSRFLRVRKLGNSGAARRKNLLSGKHNESGFITLIVCLLVILIAVITMVYLKVLKANR